MRILRIDLARLVSSGNMKTIAFFDVEVDDRIRLYGMKLIEAPSGKRVSYAPSSGGVRLATFDPSLAAAITELAETEYKGRAIRGGSVCLNSLGRFAKWISASIMPPPSSVPAR